jgi:hypothetical protein
MLPSTALARRGSTCMWSQLEATSLEQKLELSPLSWVGLVAPYLFSYAILSFSAIAHAR